jgi:hypothetical protein
VKIKAAVASPAISPYGRLRIAGLALIGQLTGYFCGALVMSLIGGASNLLPILGSPSIATLLLPLFFVGPPILGSFAYLRRETSLIRPLVVSISGFILPAVLFVWIVRLTGGDRQAIGAMLLPVLFVLPLATILGSFLGTYVPPRKERAG